MFQEQNILNQMRRRRALEPPFATPPIALDQEAEQSKSDPWSERLPDGRTVNEAIMGTLRQKQAAPFPAPPKPKLYDDGDPGTGFDYSTPGTEPLPTSTGTETRPWKVGGSLEKDPLKREAARIRAMIENPTSEVSQTGAVDTPKPMGRLKASLLGALFGLAQGDRNTSLAERLAAGGAGAGVGAFKPRAVQDWRRRLEVEDAQGQLAKQQKLGLGQAQLEGEQAETRQRQLAPEIAMAESERRARYDAERIKVQQQAAEGRISMADATRKLREMELEERKRHNLESEGIQRSRVTTAPDKTAESRAKREAKINESSSLYKKAEAAEANAAALDEHIKKLDEGLRSIEASNAEAGSDTDAAVKKQFTDQINDLKKQQQDLRKEANKLRVDGDKARSAGESIPERPAASGRRWSASKWAADPRNEGLDVEAAKRQAKAEGYTVIE
jgi:hypothetical protein